MSSPLPPTAVSAPGKVLLAGGYTVLDPACAGLVLALSARIHSLSSPSSGEDNVITVRSPQFQDALWEYRVSASESQAVSVTQINEGDENPFVATTLRYTLSYLSLPSIPSTTITILADNPYYSQPPPPLPRFNSLSLPIKSAYKTGLGSSAALVTSLTSCILNHFLPLSNLNKNGLEQHIYHNLAQASHCAAQGKVGSGFDVAAATYGSCVYRRFTPDILSNLNPSSSNFVKELKEVVDKRWTDMQVSPITLPREIGLVMGDVQCGSSTPGMVSKVLKWKKEGGEEALSIWNGLDGRNGQLIDAIKKINSTGEYKREEIKKCIDSIREAVRDLGSRTGVEIEPDSQTKLLNSAVENVEGVIGGVVPGAGGYDAVCFLYEKQGDSEQNLREYLGNYKVENGVCKALDVGQEGQGVRVESIDGYTDVRHYFEGILEL